MAEEVVVNLAGSGKAIDNAESRARKVNESLAKASADTKTLSTVIRGDVIPVIASISENSSGSATKAAVLGYAGLIPASSTTTAAVAPEADATQRAALVASANRIKKLYVSQGGRRITGADKTPSPTPRPSPNPRRGNDTTSPNPGRNNSGNSAKKTNNTGTENKGGKRLNDVRTNTSGIQTGGLPYGAIPNPNAMFNTLGSGLGGGSMMPTGDLSGAGLGGDKLSRDDVAALLRDAKGRNTAKGLGGASNTSGTRTSNSAGFPTVNTSPAASVTGTTGTEQGNTVNLKGMGGVDPSQVSGRSSVTSLSGASGSGGGAGGAGGGRMGGGMMPMGMGGMAGMGGAGDKATKADKGNKESLTTEDAIANGTWVSDHAVVGGIISDTLPDADTLDKDTETEYRGKW